MKNMLGVFIFLPILILSASALAEDPMSGDPVTGFVQRRIHHLFPFREEDEAFEAHKDGTFTDQQVEALMQGSAEDYFSQMDYGITLPENQDNLRKSLEPFFPGISAAEATQRAVRGRDNWLVFTGGNDRFWNYTTRATFSAFDLLKTVSGYPTLPYGRGNRWKELGIISEPCFQKATGPRQDRWGLWLDSRAPGCKADPFENAGRYPGVQIGSRGKALKWRGKTVFLDTGSSYGLASGIIGLRLFTNPDFDQKAADNWDPERYYNDPSYYNNPNTVRPYRVGMACAFCHVGPNPSRPPADFENPTFANLNSNSGAQYFWVDRIWIWNYKNSNNNFMYQLVHTSRPGSLDTSLVSSDQINNPRTMNAVYDLSDRVLNSAKMNHIEELSGNELLNAQFGATNANVTAPSAAVRGLSNAQAQTVITPRVLKDGSDSVGSLGALNRVMVNIGLFSENWIQNFIPFVGGFGDIGITPFRIDIANQRSLYWLANNSQTPDLALFFLASTRPDKLAEAPGGARYLKSADDPQVQLGKHVFAQNCAQCHSSKLPEKAYSFFNRGTACAGSGYLDCWNSYWEYTKSKAFKDEVEKIVMQKDFLEHNYLSTEVRIPSNVVDTVLCSPIGTNAIKGDIWDNFSSTSYKNLPSIGKFRVNFPNSTATDVESAEIDVPAGGRGYLRPPSLISLWATAPYLQNNSLGNFDYRGTVDGRMLSFTDSIHKLLDPTLRARDLIAGQRLVNYTTTFGDTLPGIIDLTTQESYLNIPRGYLPNVLFEVIKKQLDQQPKITKNMINKTYTYAMIGDAPDKDGSQKRSIASMAASNSANSDAALPPMASMGDFLQLGPIPAGVPINLISNINLQSDKTKLFTAIRALVGAVINMRLNHLTGQAATNAFLAQTMEPLLAVSKCTDFVVNRGHYFGTQYAPDHKQTGQPAMTDQEREALIEFLKFM